MLKSIDSIGHESSSSTTTTVSSHEKHNKAQEKTLDPAHFSEVLRPKLLQPVWNNDLGVSLCFLWHSRTFVVPVVSLWFEEPPLRLLKQQSAAA